MNNLFAFPKNMKIKVVIDLIDCRFENCLIPIYCGIFMLLTFYASNILCFKYFIIFFLLILFYFFINLTYLLVMPMIRLVLLLVTIFLVCLYI